MMRVLFLQRQPCIRAYKYAVALRTEHPDWHLGFAYQGLTLNGLYGTGDELFERWWELDGRPPFDLRRAIEQFRPDVIHSHNLPDGLTVLALDVTEGRIPIVHDVHDFQSLRHTIYDDGMPPSFDPFGEEQQAIEGCTALVTVSEELLDEIDALYSLPKQTLTFPNFALSCDLPKEIPPPERTSHNPVRLVYEGTLSEEEGNHYDLRQIFATLGSTEGVSLDVFPNRERPSYHQIPGIQLRRRRTPQRLLRLLPDYDFGWTGFNTQLNARHLDTALPNKMFDFLGAGLPIVTLRHKAIARFVETHGVGVVLDHVGEVRERLEGIDLAGLRRRVAKQRFDLTVEGRIHQLATLYESVV